MGLHCYLTPEQLGAAARQLAESPASHRRLARALDRLLSCLQPFGWRGEPSGSHLRLIEGTARCARVMQFARWLGDARQRGVATAAIELSPDLGQPGRAFLTVDVRLQNADHTCMETLVTSPASQSFAEVPTERVPAALSRHVLSRLEADEPQGQLQELVYALERHANGNRPAPAAGRRAVRSPLPGLILPMGPTRGG